MLFIFDENFPKDFVAGFSIIEKANKKQQIKADIVFAPDLMGRYGATDEEIIEKVAKQEAVIITHDGDFKRIKHYKPLLIEHSV